MLPSGSSKFNPGAPAIRSSNDNARLPSEPGPTSAPAQSGVTRIAIAGPIEEGLIASLLQMWANAASSGTLEVRSGREEGAIELLHGRITHARAGAMLGQAACFRILALESGEFRYRRADSAEAHVAATPEEHMAARNEIQEMLFAWIRLGRK